MADKVAGRAQKFEICTTPQTSDLTAVQFAALTYIEVCCLQDTPTLASTNSIISEDCISGEKIRLVGASEDSDIEVVYFYDSACAGQTSLRGLGLAATRSAYAVRKVYGDGTSATTPSTDYARVIFSGFSDDGVGIDDVQTHTVSGSIIQGPVFVAPAPI